MNKLSCQAILSVSFYDLNRFKANLKELETNLREIGRKMTAASGQLSTYPDMVITDIYGKAVLTFSVYPDCFCLWDYRTCRHIQDFDDIPDNLDEIIEKASEGFIKCNDCGKWFKENPKYYSYAGVVCSKCYNSEIHLPPDSR